VASLAIVMQSGPFLRPTDALKAYTSPVAYLEYREFEKEFLRVFDNIEEHTSFLRTVGEDAVLNCVFEVFRSAILCTKHPGFREEREWRVVYCPAYERSERLSSIVHSFKGIPQEVFKIPLKNVPDEGLTGVELPELIHRVIIGPTNFPLTIRDTLAKVLSEKGVKDALNKVFISDIPLR
jgi:hypothetical protein